MKLKEWTKQIFNAIVALSLHASFKNANVTPVYKGKGRDPLIQTAIEA